MNTRYGDELRKKRALRRLHKQWGAKPIFRVKRDSSVFARMRLAAKFRKEWDRFISARQGQIVRVKT